MEYIQEDLEPIQEQLKTDKGGEAMKDRIMRVKKVIRITPIDCCIVVPPEHEDTAVKLAGEFIQWLSCLANVVLRTKPRIILDGEKHLLCFRAGIFEKLSNEKGTVVPSCKAWEEIAIFADDEFALLDYPHKYDK